MTRQEAIDRWKIIAETVFTAEDNLHDTLLEIMESDKDDETKKEHYLTAIAEEIVSTTTDEELK